MLFFSMLLRREEREIRNKRIEKIHYTYSINPDSISRILCVRRKVLLRSNKNIN
jgi:hypothetical protein